MKRRKDWLIACEESGTVRDAFLRLGIPAISCDLLPTRSPGPHIQADVREVMAKEYWPRVIAHPFCTHTAVSGARHFAAKRKDGRQKEGIDFFMFFANYENEIMVIEHPVSIMSTLHRKPDQILQPWQFGHAEQKTTCLWIKGLPPLKVTRNVKNKMLKLPKNKRERLYYLLPGPNRARDRSVTYRGIADAMASQWGRL